MATYAQILSEKWPGSQWSIVGNDYSTLNWLDENNTPKPTEKEILSFSVEVDLAVSWNNIRSVRNRLLSDSDWTQLNDVPLTVEMVQKWAEYRQELRDITQTFDDPDFVIFPEKP